jgi:hypothetical protein
LRPSLDEELTDAVAGWAKNTKEASRMDDRDKMLDVTLTQIEKQFGKGAVMKLGEHPMGAGISVIPSGSLALDIALGVGGIPRGRVVEVFGPEGSGKTTVCLHIIAEAQNHGGIAAFIDAEHALDPTYAQRLGVNIDELLVSQPDSGEQALEIADMLVRSGALDVVVIDSVAALVPRAEIEGEMGDTHVGLQARLMSQAMRKLAGTLSKFDYTYDAVGNVIKINLVFRERFWEDVKLWDKKGEVVSFKDAGFFHYPDAAVPTWWTQLPIRAPLLVGWAGGPQADCLRNEGALLDRAIDSLSLILRTSTAEIRHQLEASHIHDWHDDRFSRGAYSYVTVNGLEAQQVLSQPLDNKLFFAGEATCTGHVGTVHGAIQSGQRAAREILGT